MTNTKFDIIAELQARGLMAQSTDLEELRAHLNSGMRTLYCGFDPTADSLHIGSLVPLLVLRRFQQAGHRPMVLVGGATGMIGDPSFKAAERALQTDDVVKDWTVKLQKQTASFVDFDCGENSAIALNNYDWTKGVDVITFLRDIGKHFSVNTMINRESVKQRINRPDQGISFTEFSYSILQGFDYQHLNKSHNCTLQIGGQDQWGNIVSGVELTRKINRESVHAFTMPLITKADGTKFGKSESGAVWLSEEKTSNYSFYQFWINTSDADVGNFLKYFTLIDLVEIDKLLAEHNSEPHLRKAQKVLASEVTKLVRGEEGLKAAERITNALFGGDLSELTENDLEQIAKDGLPCVTVPADMSLADVLVESALASSKREAREFVGNGAIHTNNVKLEDVNSPLPASKALFGKYHVLRRGKKKYALAVVK